MAHDTPTAGIFERRPTDQSPPDSYRIWRVGPKGKGTAIIISSDLIGCYTHYFKGRTRPCTGEKCEACANDSSRRWHSYFAAWTPTNNEKVIAEIPLSAAQVFHDWYDEHRTLRGYKFTLERRGGKINGKVFATIHAGKMEDQMIPACPAIEPMLLRMWETKRHDAQHYESQAPKIAEFPDQEQAG